MKIHLHTFEEMIDQRPFDLVADDGILEGIQYRVEANALVDGAVCLLTKMPEECRLVVKVKTVHNLVGESYKTVDGVDWIPKGPVEAPDSNRKGSAVRSGRASAARDGDFVKERFHSFGG